MACLIAFIRLRNAAQLHRARQMLAEAQTVAKIGSWEWHIQSNRIVWSDEVYRLFGVAKDDFELTRENYLTMVHPDDRPLLTNALDSLLDDQETYEIQYRVTPRHGGLRYFHSLGRVSRDQSGQPTRMVGTVQDVTDKVEAETALRENREMLHSMSLAAHDAMIMIESDDTIIFWNQAAEKMFGYSSEEALGQKVHQLIAAQEDDKRRAEEGLEGFARTGTGPVLNTVQEFTAVRRDGSEFPVERSVAAFRMGGKWYAVGSMRDITERRETQAKLEELATIDGLTGLYNRRHFNELATGQITQAQRYGQPLSLIMFDVDHFKSVNDQYGHDVGDMVLRELSRLAGETIREVDFNGRLGGEEFAICLPGTGLDGALELAERLRQRIAESRVEYPGGGLGVTISLGVAEVTDGDSLETILKRADEALYRAKESGRNRVEQAGSPTASN